MLDINMTKAEIVDYPQIVYNALAMKRLGQTDGFSLFRYVQNNSNVWGIHSRHFSNTIHRIR